MHYAVDPSRTKPALRQEHDDCTCSAHARVAAVQAARFMGCADTVKQLKAWLQGCVRTVAERGKALADRRSHHMKVR